MLHVIANNLYAPANNFSGQGLTLRELGNSCVLGTASYHSMPPTP